MASRLRDGEVNVDCKDAAELDSTARDMRMANGPITGDARAVNTLAWLSALFRPIPVSPTPANIMVAMVTSR
ncbi:hypothetical protein D3C73_1149430 [compost metagenome]